MNLSHSKKKKNKLYTGVGEIFYFQSCHSVLPKMYIFHQKVIKCARYFFVHLTQIKSPGKRGPQLKNAFIRLASRQACGCFLDQ